MTVVVPARDEHAALKHTLPEVTTSLLEADIPYEILVVDDYSSDATPEVVENFSPRGGEVRLYRNGQEPGFGKAVECGLRQASGDIVALMMADGSDRPADLIRYYEAFDDDVDCVFGSRFEDESRLVGYPTLKFVLNRLGNALARGLFGYPYRDVTNAFKAYKSDVLKYALPLESTGFEASLELPLKVLGTGATVKEVPISWEERASGTSKMNVLRDAWRYLILLLHRRARKVW